MNCSGFPPAGMVLAVASTIAPPRRRRLTMASPIPLLPPVTRIRLPLNSPVSGAGLINVFILFQGWHVSSYALLFWRNARFHECNVFLFRSLAPGLYQRRNVSGGHI